MRFTRSPGSLTHIALASVAAFAAGGVAAAGPAAKPAVPGPGAPPPNVARADQLFAEGKVLLGTNLLQACGKFDESLRENPAAIGTLLNVALCDEKLGRIASAVARFSEARDRALEQGLREHVRAANEHLAELAPKVPYLAIKLTEPVADTLILIDGRVVALDALDAVAVDPGERVIVVSAPARLPYRATLIVAVAAHQDVVVPALAKSIVIHSSQRRIGQVVATAGGVMIGTGLGLGLYARHLYRAQFGHRVPGDGLCDDMNRCEERGQSQIQHARTLGSVGTAVGVVGVAVAGVGAYLWYRAPRDSRDSGADASADPKLVVLPALTTDSLGIAAAGRF